MVVLGCTMIFIETSWIDENMEPCCIWMANTAIRVIYIYMIIYVCVDILVYKDHNDNNDIIGKILNDDYITTSTIVIMMKISIMWIRMNRMIRWKIIFVIISRCLKIKNSANQGRIQPGWWMPGVHPQKVISFGLKTELPQKDKWWVC